MKPRWGFSVVEVLVALVIFEVGLLGVVGTLALASWTVKRATLLERSIGQVEAVLDSLVRAQGGGDGGRTVPGGRLLWSVGADGNASVIFQGDAGWPRVEVWTRVHADGPR